MLVGLAVGNPIRHQTLYLSRKATLEIMLGIGNSGTIAEWWTEADFELIPSRVSQH